MGVETQSTGRDAAAFSPGAPSSADLLAAIVDSSNDAIISKDLRGGVTSWNRAAERIFGYAAEEMIGRSITVIIPEERLGEEDRILTKVRAGERVEPFETVRVRKDGSTVEVSLTISPVKDAGGQVVGASKIARDITGRKRVERELRRREELLADFFENGGVGLHWVGGDGRILKANRAELEMLGYSSDEYIGRSIADFHVDAPVISDILARLKRGEPVDGQEARLRCKDGSIKHVLITSNTLYENGKFVHTRCFTRDITWRKRAEEEARRTIRELDDLRTALDEHAIVAVTDPQGKITYVNDKFCAISKYSREELIGKDHRIINSGHHSKEFIRELWRTIRAGNVWKGELKNRAKDGTFYWVDTTIVPYLDDRGRPTQFVAIRADISDRKAAEEKLRESEERFRTMADASPVLIWVAGPDGMCNYFNKGWLDFVGRPMVKELGAGWMENLHPDDYERCAKVLASAFEARRPFEMEYRMRHHTGEYRWVLDRGVPRFGPDETFQGFIGGCFDIETQKRAEEKLEQLVAKRTLHLKESVESLEGVCYTIAHDLRAPLRAIYGYTRVLTEDYGHCFDEEGQMVSRRVLQATSRMDDLINDLLEYAKLSHLELEWEPVDLNDLVGDVRSDLAPEIESKGARIEVAPLPTVRGHRTLLEQVFTNLLGNALKFVAPGVAPRIEIAAERSAGRIRIAIQDNGIGISSDHRDAVFNVFQRLHRDELTYPGTGVGLAIVKKSMERMGGGVEIDPKVMHGTRFVVEFPVNEKL